MDTDIENIKSIAIYKHFADGEIPEWFANIYCEFQPDIIEVTGAHLFNSGVVVNINVYVVMSDIFYNGLQFSITEGVTSRTYMSGKAKNNLNGKHRFQIFRVNDDSQLELVSFGGGITANFGLNLSLIKYKKK